jgi:hypothetical protein
MWYSARPVGRVARSKQVPLVADFDNVLAFNDVEPFVLIAMQVPGRAAFGMVYNLRDQKCPVAVRRRDFEIPDC